MRQPPGNKWSESFSVVRTGDQIRIKGGRLGSAATKRILAWLATRPEVDEVHKRRTGAVDVRLKNDPQHPDQAGAGAFLRSLDDHLYQLESAPTPPCRVEIVHALPGRARFQVSGCDADTILRLAAYLTGQPGVLRASPSPAAASIVVVFEPAETDETTLARLLDSTPHGSLPTVTPEPAGAPWRNTALSTVVFGAAVVGGVPPAALAAGIALTAIPPARRALTALLDRRLSVDVLDLAAVGISIGTGQPGTAAFITWLLSVGDLLLERSADRARAAISKLVGLDAKEAWIIVGDRVEKIAADKLTRGDLIQVSAGHRVAADGVVRKGIASIDEKALTGESVPRVCNPGDRVLAATVVLEGELVVEVERAGTDTTAAKIVKLLEGAGRKPMTLQKNAEKITDRLTAPTLALAGGAAFLTGQIDRMTSVLITDFGTGVRLALPASALTAMALAARDGVLVKGAQYLERLAKTDVVVFDKTGTLTSGAPQVVEVLGFGGHDARTVLGLCAGAEAQAAHPIAEAIRRHATRDGIEIPAAELGSTRYAIGKGIAARVAGLEVLVGNPRWLREHRVDAGGAQAALAAHKLRGASSLLVAIDGKLAGVMAYADRPRPESIAVVRALKSRRRRVVLLSGDGRHPVEMVARAIGVDEAHGEMLPEDKAAFVKELQRQGAVVAMVGDGINDAPALSAADVGISLHGGTDVALETADVVLLEAGLGKLPGAFIAGERALRHVQRGLGIVIVPNAIAIALGALGLIGPGVAAIANNGSTVVAALAAVAPILWTPKKKP